MKQVTCVAFYGNQIPKEFQEYLKNFQTDVYKTLGSDFKPYDVRQIHGTIIGMEKLIGYRENANFNRWDIEEKIELMKFDKFIEILQYWNYPIKIRFGGFNNEYKEFLSGPGSGSEQSKPYYRSFSVNVGMGKVVLIG